jgi:hypothetical protein
MISLITVWITERSAVTGPRVKVVQQRRRFVRMKGDSTVSGLDANSQARFGRIDRISFGSIDLRVAAVGCCP